MFYISESKLPVPKSDEKFEYVVERKEQQKICFGSTQVRNTSAICEKRLIKVGPGSYNIKSSLLQLLNKVRSKKGVPGLANGAPRFEKKAVDQTPSPTRYDTFPKWPKRGDGAAPFGCKSKRVTLRTSKYPGPGTYNHKIWKCRRTLFDSNFGKPTMIPTIEEICVPDPVDTCSKCGNICTGDYWQQNHSIYLCQVCMAEETRLHEMYKREQLKSFEDVTAEEFVTIMTYLTTSKVANTHNRQLELINVCTEQVELEHDFDMFAKECNSADRLIICVKFALPFISAKIESTKFVKYICDQVLPTLEEIKEIPDGKVYQLGILRQLAELSTHCGKLENPSAHVIQIYDKIKAYMPSLPEDTTLTALPHLDFSSVEALLYAFHRLARQCPDFMTHDPQELKDFHARLLYFSRGVQTGLF